MSFLNFDVKRLRPITKHEQYTSIYIIYLISCVSKFLIVLPSFHLAQSIIIVTFSFNLFFDKFILINSMIVHTNYFFILLPARCGDHLYQFKMIFFFVATVNKKYIVSLRKL
jgi:hypothetical protein